MNDTFGRQVGDETLDVSAYPAVSSDLPIESKASITPMQEAKQSGRVQIVLAAPVT